MIAVTGATGQLGRLSIDALLKKVPAEQIVAIVRDPAKAADLAAKGVTVREGDYEKPETLASALTGIEKLLLISSNNIGQRAPQHQAVIDAAKQAGVQFIAYTSILRADQSPIGLADEHRQTELALQASGIPHAVLRNGWYTENYAAAIPAAVEHGVHYGSAGDGLVATASRRDYAEAAAAVISSTEDQNGRIYELAGDQAFTMAQFAQEIARQSGKPVKYQDLSDAEFKANLVGAGVPEGFAALLVDWDSGVAKGALFDDGHQLSQLIGHPTTLFAETVKDVLAG